MFMSNHWYACILCLILNKEVHRHRTVKIESLAMHILLDSEEVCVKLENGLIMNINLAFVSLTRNFCRLCLQKHSMEDKHGIHILGLLHSL